MTFALPRVGVWTGQLDVVPAARSQELAGALEALGYGAIWVPEVAGRDVMVQLALFLSSTTSVVGATGIASIYARDPITMAGAHRGLEEAFPERVLLGLGVSHHTLVSDLRGHDYSRPLAAMSRYLDAMDASPYTGARPTTEPQRVLAALGPKMLELSAARSEGAHTYFVPPEHTASARAILGDAAFLCVEQAVLLESDPDVARAWSRAYAATYLALPNYTNNLRRLGYGEDDIADGGSDRLIDAIVAWGDEEAIAARVRAHFDAGADHVCIQALPSSRRDVPEEQWRRLAPAVLAAGE